MAATIEQFRELLDAEDSVDMLILTNIAKHGIPPKVRGEVWKYLLSVSKPDKSEEMKHERRQQQEYREIDKTHSADLKNSIRHQINRIYPKNSFFHQEAVQLEIKNVISADANYNTATRHIDIDFTRGILSLLGPIVSNLKNESEVFWCFEAFMKKLEHHFAEDSLQDQLSRFMMYFQSVHPELFNYFEEEELLPNDWAMSWLKYVLSHELPFECVLRLWDTYFANPDGFDLHIYVCIAILRNCTEELMELDLSELKGFLRHLPCMDMDEIISQAYNIRDEIKSNNF